ncbi:hypothetical protein M431DRAFT_215462 [Trichoderma harzianum CBS 226.95]|uniref:Uncharacterized protein n=1 Tax=Trichoderma harzianum CBS 226.95 TaxID=983964 RepID=A0A2T4A5G1_TRIHA|nr:hypothetical protein M431DRAFT_215462 [Trichoderma harzianum CBS 226.95]PTB52310.1 hypothetical protein M431DRAFT_215462 [Trichoderma harzianum CBS 226.95]
MDVTQFVFIFLQVDIRFKAIYIILCFISHSNLIFRLHSRVSQQHRPSPRCTHTHTSHILHNQCIHLPQHTYLNTTYTIHPSIHINPSHLRLCKQITSNPNALVPEPIISASPPHPDPHKGTMQTYIYAPNVNVTLFLLLASVHH